MEVIAELMVDENLIKHQNDIYDEFKSLNIKGQRAFSELNSGMWWQETELQLRRRHGDDSYLLPVIIYLDATQLDATGKCSTKPVCITLGNFSITLRVSI